MTYCVAITVDAGFVFASDSRTHAGVDQVSPYSKMHTFGCDGDRQVVLLNSGNLATTQAVITQMRRDRDEKAAMNIDTARDSLRLQRYRCLKEDDSYLIEIKRAWNEKIAQAFAELPTLEWTSISSRARCA